MTEKKTVTVTVTEKSTSKSVAPLDLPPPPKNKIPQYTSDDEEENVVDVTANIVDPTEVC